MRCCSTSAWTTKLVTAVGPACVDSVPLPLPLLRFLPVPVRPSCKGVVISHRLLHKLIIFSAKLSPPQTCQIAVADVRTTAAATPTAAIVCAVPSLCGHSLHTTSPIFLAGSSFLHYAIYMSVYYFRHKDVDFVQFKRRVMALKLLAVGQVLLLRSVCSCLRHAAHVL